MKYFVLLLFTITISVGSKSQNKTRTESIYNPRDLFPASSIIPAGNPYREANGEVGHAYWQNRADYHIDASLDDEQHIIHGTALITYTNNSPYRLPYLWLQLDQNAFRRHSKGLDSKIFLDSNEVKTGEKFEGGYVINSVQITDNKALPLKNEEARYVINDTRMQLFLSQPLPTGEKISFKIGYSYTIPRFFYNAQFNTNRTNILPTRNGNIYSIAQWYPRLCVLDDLEGWNTLPYLGNGEFYLEYGNFIVNLTLPSAYIVEASGELINPQEVMTPVQLKRWEQAKNSEQKVFIRTPGEVTETSSRPSKPTCTWKFKIDNSRDFAWAASKSFIWEGIRINLPSGKKAMGISVYPVESKQPASWERSSEYVKFSIEYFSKKWYEYPYPRAVNVASNVDGMEYPGIVFCSEKDTGNFFWAVVNHELGHTWFPMIVGSNERKYAWMDEGFNMLIDNLASASFNSGEFKGFTALQPPYEEYFADSLVPVNTRPDGVKGKMVLTTQYLKPEYVLRLLRDHIIGTDRFDYAFSKYIHDWAFKHPAPWDFFRSINNSTGEDLTWFWKGMFIENYKLDQAITGMAYINNDPSKGANISVTNLEKAAMPMIIEITTTSGKKDSFKFPVEIWEYSGRFTFKTETTEVIQSIVIDPDRVYPDMNRANNIWKK